MTKCKARYLTYHAWMIYSRVSFHHNTYVHVALSSGPLLEQKQETACALK